MVGFFRILLDYFMVICIVFGSIMTGGASDKELQIIGDNIVNGILDGTFSPFSSSDINDPDEIISLIEYDGDGNCYFSDVNYADTDRSNWTTKRHLNRAERLAILYRKETDSEKKKLYKDYVMRLLEHWIKNDYQNSNWWYNKLATPNTLGEIGLLMKKDLSFRQLIQLGELVGRGCFSVNTPVKTHAGANIIDIAMSSIKFGVLTDSRSAVKTAVKMVADELDNSEDEGLRADATFFQHGCRLYMGGYGITFISGMSELIFMLSGTKYNFTSDQLTKLSDFIVDGIQVMSFGNILDPTTMGRSISRNNSQPLNGLSKSLRKLAAVDEMPRRDEILKYAQSIENNEKKDTGVHYFDEAKFIVINDEDFYFSFRGGADYLVYSEIINDENILGYNSSFPGVTTIMHTGNEYTNISPVYDFSMVPGATAVYETDAELKAHDDFTYRYLSGTFGSCAKDGAALSFAQTEHEGIKMTVTCFATDNAAFLLGTGFSDSENRELITTIDQSFAAGDFTCENNTAIHNGIKYTLIDGGTLNACQKHVTGSWHRNNLGYSDTAVEGDIFTASFVNNGSYAYSVMTEDTDESITVIQNTPDIQAVVMPDGTVAAVFYKNGSFAYNGHTYTGQAGQAYFYAE